MNQYFLKLFAVLLLLWILTPVREGFVSIWKSTQLIIPPYYLAPYHNPQFSKTELRNIKRDPYGYYSHWYNPNYAPTEKIVG